MTQLPSSFGEKRKRDQVPALGVASGCQAALPAGSRGLPAMEGCQEGGPGACSQEPAACLRFQLRSRCCACVGSGGSGTVRVYGLLLAPTWLRLPRRAVHETRLAFCVKQAF